MPGNMEYGNAKTTRTTLFFLFYYCTQLRLSTPCDTYFVNKEIYVNCSKNSQVTTVPSSLPNETVWLNLSYTNLIIIKNDAFAYMPLLRYLDLYSANLRELEPRAFAGLHYLLYLNISGNDYLPQTDGRTPEQLYEDLTSLKELRMYATTTIGVPGTYPDKALSYLSNLTHLYMDGLFEQEPGPGFLNLTKLQFLSISGDHFPLGGRFCHANITEHFLQHVRSITHLEIRYCAVQYIHNYAFENLTSLTYLDLSGNMFMKFGYISNAIESLKKTNLTVLKLNKVYDTQHMTCGPVLSKEFCQQLGKLKKLKELHIESNAIVAAEKHALLHLPHSLEILKCSDNEFEMHYYLFELYTIKGLRELDVSYQFFPDTIWEKEKKRPFPNIDIPTLQPVSVVKQLEFAEQQSESVVQQSKIVNQQSRTFVQVSETNVRIREAAKARIDVNSIWRSPHHEFRKTQTILNHGDKKTEAADNMICDNTFVENICPDNGAYTKLPAGLIQPFLPPNLESIDISYCKLHLSISNLTIAGKNAITKVSAKGSMIYCWVGPVKGLEGIKILDLSYNYCVFVSNYFFGSSPNLEIIDLSYNSLGESVVRDVNGCIFQNQTKLRIIDLSFNMLFVLPRNFFRSQFELQELYLNTNMLRAFELNIDHMKSLRKVNLQYNYISTLSVPMRKSLERAARNLATYNDTFEINLKNNDILCNCYNLDFIQWLYDHEPKNLQVEIGHCIFDNRTIFPLYASNQTLHEVLITLHKHCSSYVSVIVVSGICLGVFINIVVARIVYRYRWRLQYLYYRRGRKSIWRMNLYRDENANEFKYDAFIVLDDGDDIGRTFVESKLIPHIEGSNRNLKLTIGFRDWVKMGGKLIHNLTTETVHSSRTTVFLITKASIESPFLSFAVHMAKEESLYRGYNVYYAIQLEDISRVNFRMKRQTEEIFGKLQKVGDFVQYPENEEPEIIELFWDECARRIQHPEGNQNFNRHTSLLLSDPPFASFTPR